MKFTIDREVFVEALFAAKVVVRANTNPPVLACCLIQAHEDGRIVVHGTNLTVWVSRTVKADVSQPGSVVVDMGRVYQTANSSPAGPVKCCTTGQGLVIDQSRVHARVNEIAPERFPDLPELIETSSEVEVATLLDLIEKTFFCVGQDESQAVFCAGHLHTVGDGLRLAASDRMRFAQVTVRPSPREHWGRWDALVPREGLDALRRLLSGDGLAKFAFGGNEMRVATDDLSVSIRLIPGRYPDCSHVFGHGVLASATVNRDTLNAAVKRAAIFAGKSNRIRLTLSEGTIEVHSTDGVSGELTEPVPCVCETQGFTLHYNYKYLRDVLAVIEGDDVKLGISGHSSPTYVTDSARPDVAYVVMPMDEAKEEMADASD